jgi:anti-sigma regulatory factor (Ser/Thr protein kinase)
MGRSTHDVYFPLTATAPRRARSWAKSILHVDEHPRDVVLLLLSELVTNSVRYGGTSPRDRVEVGVRQEEGVIHIEVRDPGPGVGIAPGDFPMHSGLRIVDALSARWGVRHNPTTVWFDVTG